MRPGINRVAKNLIYIQPNFIHEFGWLGHHTSLMRTCEIDEEYGGWIHGTGPSRARFRLHEALDDYFFYPAQSWLRKYFGYGRLFRISRAILGFAWGFNCGFPARDVALYTMWVLRGCAPRAVYHRIAGEWLITYPREQE